MRGTAPWHLVATLVFALLCTGVLSAAPVPDGPRNLLYAGYGLGSYGRQDQVFTPMVHGGLGPVNLRIGYEHDGAVEHTAAVAYRAVSSGIPAPFEYRDELRDRTWTALSHSISSLSLSYGAAAGVVRGLHTLLRLGGDLQARADLLNYAYGPSVHFGYHAVFGLGPTVAVLHRVSPEDQLRLRLRVTALAWTARSPYLVNDAAFIENTSSHDTAKTFLAFVADGRLESVDVLQDAELSVEYRRLLGRHWALMLRVDSRFLRAVYPRPLAALDTVLSLGGGIRL